MSISYCFIYQVERLKVDYRARIIGFGITPVVGNSLIEIVSEGDFFNSSTFNEIQRTVDQISEAVSINTSHINIVSIPNSILDMAIICTFFMLSFSCILLFLELFDI